MTQNRFIPYREENLLHMYPIATLHPIFARVLCILLAWNGKRSLVAKNYIDLMNIFSDLMTKYNRLRTPSITIQQHSCKLQGSNFAYILAVNKYSGSIYACNGIL